MFRAEIWKICFFFFFLIFWFLEVNFSLYLNRCAFVMFRHQAHFGQARMENFHHADSKDWSDRADAQADVRLRWVNMSKGTFFHIRVHFTLAESNDSLPAFYTQIAVSYVAYFLMSLRVLTYLVSWEGCVPRWFLSFLGMPQTQIYLGIPSSHTHARTHALQTELVRRERSFYPTFIQCFKNSTFASRIDAD